MGEKEVGIRFLEDYTLWSFFFFFRGLQNCKREVPTMVQRDFQEENDNPGLG